MATIRTSKPPAAAVRSGIVAGGGRLPIEIANGLDAAGTPPFVIIVRGEVEDEAALAKYPHQVVEIEQFGELIQILKREGVDRVVMAGNISRRPKLLDVRPKWPILRLLPRALVALASGDDALLRFVIGHVESNGIKVVGAHEILPDLLVGEGVHTKAKPSAQDRKEIAAAFVASQAIGKLDIGQAAVAIGGRVIALEGIEGTDGLLERVAALRDHGRLAGRKGGVLVKTAKPGQELRTDLPSIGLSTVEKAHRAGLSGIAVQAERSLGLGFKEMIERADALKMFVVGLPRDFAP